MSKSIRQRIIDNIADRLRAVASANNAGFFLHPRVPIKREHWPALALIVDGEYAPQRSNLQTERRLAIRLSAIAGETDPWSIADELIATAHAAMMGNPSHGGLATGTTEDETTWDIEDADGDAVLIPAAYIITYRTAAADLISPG